MFMLFCVHVYFYSESGDFLDEESHLVFLDGAWAILVEFFETFIEVLFVELILVVSISHLLKGVLDELLGLLLVESTRVVFVVGTPDVLNDFSDNGINVTHV